MNSGKFLHISQMKRFSNFKNFIKNSYLVVYMSTNTESIVVGKGQKIGKPGKSKK